MSAADDPRDQSPPTRVLTAKPPQRDFSQTLARGLDVLMLLAEADVGLSPTQIAERLGLNRTIVYRLLATLDGYNLVRRDSDGLVSLGIGVVRLTENLRPRLGSEVNEILAELADQSAATAHFVVADGDKALALAVVEPRSTTFHIAYRVGSRTPMGVGAIGKALQAAQRGEGGLFESEGELISGARGVVAPILGPSSITAAVGVVTMASAVTGETRRLVSEAGARLSRKLAAV